MATKYSVLVLAVAAFVVAAVSASPVEQRSEARPYCNNDRLWREEAVVETCGTFWDVQFMEEPTYKCACPELAQLYGVLSRRQVIDLCAEPVAAAGYDDLSWRCACPGCQ
ncbi:uncharacterized protein LOC117641873 [Thrips palmi]|uniref:Uncharacterized protein LOC117641873 n=1 Tax=Thrips palmi TaxID=161013 RepID=A0A6P8ZJK5_THRPL|nr:uncharacterized protein LOC117641873 [Thrips palmi]